MTAVRAAAPRLALVDDHSGIRRLLVSWLAADYEVAAFASGEELLGRLPALAPRLLILDLYMPGLCGLRLARQVRSNGGHGNLPVLFISAHRIGPAAVAHERMGTDFLKKPFSRHDLLERVASLLSADRGTLADPLLWDLRPFMPGYPG